MWKALSENKLASSLLAAYVIAMTGGVITSNIVNFSQDTAHNAEVVRSKGVDELESARTTFAIGLALKAKEMAVANDAVAGVHHHD